MPRGARQTLGWILAGLLAAALGVALLLRDPTRGHAAALPDPNAFDAFVRAGARVVLPDDLPGRESNETQLDALVASNRPAITQAIAALAGDCRVPVPANPELWADHAIDLPRLRALSRAFELQATAELRRRDATACVATVTNHLRFLHQSCRGGLLIHDLIFVGSLHLALRPLTAALPQLPAPDARAAARALLAIDATREPISEVRANEMAYGRRTPGLVARFRWWVFGRRDYATMFASHEPRRHAATLQVRTLALRLAARAYALERGSRPDTAAALVPDYLLEIPVDPTSGKPLDLPLGSAGSP